MIGIKLEFNEERYDKLDNLFKVIVNTSYNGLRKGYNEKSYPNFISLNTEYSNPNDTESLSTSMGIYLRPKEKKGEISLFSLSKKSIEETLKILELALEFPIKELNEKSAFRDLI